MEKIAVIGMGYVGVPVAIAFGEAGHHVIGVNKTIEKVGIINSGCCPLMDTSELDDRVKKLVDTGMLFATTDTTRAVRESDVVIITVQTPITSDKRPDLSYIISAGKAVALGLHRNELVVLESTVYPGLTEEVLQPLLEESGLRAGPDFGLAYCPERINIGDSEHTVNNVTRVVGAITYTWAQRAADLYKHIVDKVYIAEDIRTAEASKLVENIQRDTNIALMNEFALIFEHMDIDVNDVIKAAATKWNFVRYNPGAVGGDCLPANPYYIIQKSEECGYRPQLIAAAREVNESVPEHIVFLTIDALNSQKLSIKDSNIIVLGMAYKENIGDIRESPSVKVIEKLNECGAYVYVIDPYVDDSVLSQHAIPLECNLKAFANADAVVLMTSHDAFLELNLGDIKYSMKHPIIIDSRRSFDQAEVEQMGFVYRGLGARNKKE
jgi:nucleotide sugar dehydrogenase